MKFVELDIDKVCKVRFIENGILQLDTLDDVDYDMAKVTIIINYLTQLASDKPFKLLVIAAESSNITVDSLRLLSSSAGMNYVEAQAYVLSTLSQKLMANFYLKFLKSEKPVKFFKDKDSAISWLMAI
jgi:hypothetical protein